MLSFGNRKVSMESYKGVRDFYPEAQAVQNYIFGTMRQAVESFGFVEYSASILEPADLYKAKSSDEIVREQTYTFEDRGGREVTLRPEMTPTVARMIAAKYQETPFPARWYSIPNLFRYEKPQRGRLREHWQLNADIFGSTSEYADAEIIALASSVMKGFGAKPEDFEIRLNSREFLADLIKSVGISTDKTQDLYRALDKKEKVSGEEFKNSIEHITGKEAAQKILELLYYGEAVFSQLSESQASKTLSRVMDILRDLGVSNIKLSPTLTRGFDYYTGVVFEVFDTNPENPRSLFGGGRYDRLTEVFIKEPIPAVGFGMGDVTIRDFLEVHGLLPEITSTTDLWLAVAPETDMQKVYNLAQKLREAGVKVGVDISGKKLSDQLKLMEKRKILFVIVVGESELASQKFVLRNTQTREEKEVNLQEIPAMLK